MSTYTTQVRYICESISKIENNYNESIEKSWDKIFDFSFPIFDEKYRKVLCTKILKHFYMKEIGQETVGLWKMRLDAKLNEIMPYYNQLYKSQLIEINPFYDVDYVRTKKGEKNDIRRTNSNNKDSNSSSGSQSISSINKFSDTPNGSLIGVDDDEYLTNARKNEQNSNYSQNASNIGEQNINENINTTDDYLEIIRGKNGSASNSSLLSEYRKTFLNIDMQIIEELYDLFMLIY